MFLSLALENFMHVLLNVCWIFRWDPLQISGVLSADLPSLVLCLANSSCLGLPGLSIHFLNPRSVLASTLVPLYIATLSKMSNCRANLWLWSQRSLLFIAWCPMFWKSSLHKCYLFLSCVYFGFGYYKKINLVPVTPSWPLAVWDVLLIREIRK